MLNMGKGIEDEIGKRFNEMSKWVSEVCDGMDGIGKRLDSLEERRGSLSADLARQEHGLAAVVERMEVVEKLERRVEACQSDLLKTDRGLAAVVERLDGLGEKHETLDRAVDLLLSSDVEMTSRLLRLEEKAKRQNEVEAVVADKFRDFGRRLDEIEEIVHPASKLDRMIAAAPDIETIEGQKAILDRATMEKVKEAISPKSFKPMIEKPVKPAEINYCPCGSVMLPSTEWSVPGSAMLMQRCKSGHSIDVEAFAPKS